jgi:hypothetical protein
MENIVSTEPISLDDKATSLNVAQKDETKDEQMDVKILDGDNKVDVDIEPDVKHNVTNIQLCSCSIILNCFTRNTTAKN